MAAAERMTIERLERNIASFEELVQTILESGEDGFDEANRRWSSASLNPRAMRSIPAPCVLASLLAQASWGLNLATSHPARSHALHRASGDRTEVDAIVTELKSLAASFKPVPDAVQEEEEALPSLFLTPPITSHVSVGKSTVWTSC